MGKLVEQAVGVVGGAVGSKLITQMVLTSSNTGIMGYLGNAVSTGLLAWGTNALLKKRDLAQAVMLGGAVQIILRAINDFTPYGSYLSLSGLGDYQIANFPTPSWYANGLRSPNPSVPNGWGGAAALPAPTTKVVNSSGAGSGATTNTPGMSGYVPNWD